MRKSYDATIIGGGIIGLSTAYYLLKHGYKVILLEKNEIGSGASSACDDMILLQSKKPGIALELALDSLEMYRSLPKELAVDLQFQSRGGMIVIENNQELKAMEEFVENQRKYGLEVEIIDKKDVSKKQPHINENVVASTFSNKDAQVNPFSVMKGFLFQGSRLGLEVRKGINITNILQKKDYWKITLDDGSCIETENIINTAGAWASSLGELIGIDIPIVPKKGQLLVTEQIPQLGDTNVWSADYIVSKLRPELSQNQNKNHIFKKLGIGFSFTQSSHGNYLIGSTRENVGFNKETNYETLNILACQAVKFFPILKNVHVIRSFAGLRPTTPDGKSIISEVPDRKGFYIAAGHEGDGIALAPITGKLMADLVGQRKIGYDITELSFERFRHKEGVKNSEVV